MLDLAQLATGREFSLFDEDLMAFRSTLESTIGGRRILVVGGAGSIGSATVRLLAEYRPRSLHVIDLNENELAELVRDLRASPSVNTGDLRMLPIDFGSPVTRRLLLEEAPYDVVLNFAALKHVRSEKDTPSLLQMLDTNVVKQARFFRWCMELPGTARYFCVSTDKAANPVNLMGASKRILEHVVMSDEIAVPSGTKVTSARFANVAFSNGSLLDSFSRRIEKRQPLVSPRDTRRYFISMREAAQICLLACFAAPDRHIVVPKLDAESDLKTIDSVARAYLAAHGFDPVEFESPQEACESVERCVSQGRYPLLMTPLDTSGEKPYEEFVGERETVTEIGMAHLHGVPYVPARTNATFEFVDRIETLLDAPASPVSKEEIVQWVTQFVDEFKHVETGKHLDQRI